MEKQATAETEKVVLLRMTYTLSRILSQNILTLDVGKTLLTEQFPKLKVLTHGSKTSIGNEQLLLLNVTKLLKKVICCSLLFSTVVGAQLLVPCMDIKNMERQATADTEKVVLGRMTYIVSRIISKNTPTLDVGKTLVTALFPELKVLIHGSKTAIQNELLLLPNVTKLLEKVICCSLLFSTVVGVQLLVPCMDIISMERQATAEMEKVVPGRMTCTLSRIISKNILTLDVGKTLITELFPELKVQTHGSKVVIANEQLLLPNVTKLLKKETWWSLLFSTVVGVQLLAPCMDIKNMERQATAETEKVVLGRMTCTESNETAKTYANPEQVHIFYLR